MIDLIIGWIIGMCLFYVSLLIWEKFGPPINMDAFWCRHGHHRYTAWMQEYFGVPREYRQCIYCGKREYR